MSVKRGSANTPMKRRVIALFLGLMAATVLGLGLAPAASAMPVQFFYVPFPEDDYLNAFQSINATNPVNPVTSYITITAVGDDTVIYYDQWENGYDTDIANSYNIYSATNLGGTQIWGDGNLANGIPPGFATDEIDAGAVIDLNNQIQTGTLETVIDFDGGDKIAATKTVAVTRCCWASGSLTLLAGSIEVYDTNAWGTDFRAPVGENIPDTADYQMFEYTALSIMAGEGGAHVQIDANADNTYETTVDLLEGGSYFVDGGVYMGGHVLSDKPIQVHIFNGDVGSNYESRDSALIPTGTWSSDYYTPVSTATSAQGYTGTATTVWLYNPGTSAVAVTYAWRPAAGGAIQTSALSIPAGSYLKQVLPVGTSGHFYSSGATFYAFSTTDSTSGNSNGNGNQAWDWGYTMIPRYLLTTQSLVGLGIGRDPTSDVNPDENGNPVWVTPVGNGDTATRVYIDYDADPATGVYTDPSGNGYDAYYDLQELQQAKIYVAPHVQVDASSTGTTGDGASADFLDVTHITGTRNNRLMLVSVAIANDSAQQRSVSSVTYGGTALTRVGTVTAPSNGGGDGSNTYARPTVTIYAMANPPSGSATVRVTLSGTKAFTVGVTTFSGVDVSTGLTSALGTFASASARNGTTPNVNVTTVAGQRVYDTVAAGVNAQDATADPSTFTIGTGQTQLWTLFARSEDGTRDRHVRAAASTETATGTTTPMSWTSTTSYPWAIGAVPIKPASEVDQTGILVYTLDQNVKLAVAWGQDVLIAQPGSPGLDVGTSVPPMPEFTAGKDSALYTDNDGDGFITAGDVIQYTISIYNVSRLPVPNVIVKDVSPGEEGSLIEPDTDIAYVPNSTYVNGAKIDDSSSGTAFPLDGAGYTISGNLGPRQSYTVKFLVTIDRFENLTANALAVLNEGTVSALNIDDPIDDRAWLRARLGNFVWWDSDEDGYQDPEEGGIAGVTITLYDGKGNTVYTPEGVHWSVVTDEEVGHEGAYDFYGLLPGDYIVEFVPPSAADTDLTPIYNGNALVKSDTDSDANPATNRTYVIHLGGGEHNATIDAGIVVTQPTQVVVGSFEAFVLGGQVVAGWTTASEVGTAGFYVERLAPDSTWVRVNDRLVAALFESHNGGSYSVVDPGAQPGEALTYRLVEKELSGRQRVYGPYEVVAAQPLPGDRGADQIALGRASARIPKSTRPAVAVQQGPASAAVAVASRPADRLRIEVATSGFYRIEVADLAAGLGMTEDRAAGLIRSKGLKLTNQGKTVAYLQAPDYSAIYFYGRALDSIYAANNVYWLTLGKGVVMTTARGGGRNAAGAATFVANVHFEQDVLDFPGVFTDPESDFWLWDYLAADDPDYDSKTIEVDAPEAVRGVGLSVSLLGLTATGQANEHHVQVSLNGTVLGDVWWNGMVLHEATFAIPEGVLSAGANDLTLRALLDGGIDYSMVAVDSVDLTYERSTAAGSDQLLLTSSAGGLVQVTSLSTTKAWILDLADPYAPKVLKATSTGGDEGAAWVTFDTKSGGQYLVATAAGALRPQTITATTGTTLTKPGRGAVYVVITAPALAGAAGRLADYRAANGLKTAVVTTTEIYDEFNNGIPDPHAIQSFIAYATAKWKPIPNFVVLAGEGSYDYKNNLGYGDSLVPPLMVATGSGLAPSDVQLADVKNADGVPEVAIGRLPALTDEELDASLAKIEAYESEGGSWRRQALFVADDADGGDDFAADSDGMAGAVPASFTTTDAHLDGMAPAAASARALLLGSFADGALLVNYIGHGGVDQLADEELLTTDDVPGLPANTRLPLLTAFTCTVGQYAYTDCDNLGETLVKRAGGGAIAVWSTSTLAQNADSVVLGKQFMKKLFGTSGGTLLGTAIRSAHQAAAGQGVPVWTLLTYNLLGDPALNVKW